MEFFEVIHNRQSIRAFKPQPVLDDTLQRIIEAAQSAPSAGNLQAYEIIVIRDASLRAELGAATTNGVVPIGQAPISLVFVANAFRSGMKYGPRGINLFCLQDATVAATYALLAATALGLATCWIGGFDNSALGRILALQNGLWPVAILAVGYPAESPERRSRREIKEIVHELA